MDKSKPAQKGKSTGEKNAKKKPPALFPIVAIGASAGGLEAISELLEHLPTDLGMAYIIIQHLAPDHKSILPELLEKKTDMPVHKVEDNMPVKQDQLYVIPPNTFMSIVDSHLKLMPRTKSKGAYHTIDYFLAALAPVYKSQAIGIILSGTANDGTMGVKEIKAEGGITFAQDETAKYQGMPQNAAHGGYVDFVLSPKEIAKELTDISQHPFGMAPEKPLTENENEIRRILVILQAKHGVDFSCYKKNTIHRRIIRRMVLNQRKTLKEYVQMLRENDKETNLLYQDLLINVTNFFRDPSIYEALVKKILPRLLKDRKPSDPLRIWVPGCASGEEAYTIAICVMEYFNENAINIPIQIFATDLDQAAIEKARNGIYLKSMLENISPARFNRFFVRINGSYQVVKAIGDTCIFAVHNLLKDPPFSRMDIISCRNVLIYLKPDAQKKILQSFHYSLKQNSYLLLGKSETTGNDGDFFELMDKENKIYTRKAATDTLNFDFSKRTSYMRNRQEENILSSRDIEQDQKPDVEKEMDKVLLSQYIPASLLINKDLNIIGFRGNTAPYLAPASGKASFHLLKIVRDELVFELKTLINKAKKESRSVKKERIAFQANSHSREVNIEVAPIRTTDSQACYLAVFTPTPYPPETPSSPANKKQKQDGSSQQITLLEQQLKDARDHIKSLSEEFESTREELQSSNEEVLSSNEELQSMNEELETSQEELQSTNEELVTINDELQNRNVELKEAIEYNNAIISTMRGPLIVLNADMRVVTANDAYYKLFSVNQEEIEGRLFYEINDGAWNIAALQTLLREISAENKTVSDFKIKNTFPHLGERIMMLNANRMTQEEKLAKILISLEDITERMEAEQQKDDFINIAAHELKTPVTSLRIYNQILHQKLLDNGNKEPASLVEKMGVQVERIIVLINNLLDLARAANGVLPYEEAVFDLNELIAETVKEMQVTTEKHKLIKELQPVPQIRGDKNRIEQVLVNLISNAVKYSPDADKIIIRSKAYEQNIEVSVKDFGIGIKEDVQTKIFQRFFRTDASKDSYNGIGLGLFISAEIIKRHGGRMWVDSKSEKGSEFHFTLPCKELMTND